MLSDPLRAMRVTLAVGGAALVWIAAYAILNEAILDAIGDAAHALFFASIVVAASSAVIALVFRRFDRIRGELMAGRTLARWRVTKQEWEAFARKDEPATRADQRVTLGLIVFFAVVIPAVMALGGGDPQVLAVIALGVGAVGFLGYGLGRRQAQAVARYRDGVVALGPDGIIVNGAFHSWRTVGGRIVGAGIDARETPALMTLVYAYWLRSGEQHVTVRAPVPRASLDAARAALAKLPPA